MRVTRRLKMWSYIDQINVNFCFEKKLSAIDIASVLFDKILKNENVENPLVMNF